MVKDQRKIVFIRGLYIKNHKEVSYVVKECKYHTIFKEPVRIFTTSNGRTGLKKKSKKGQQVHPSQVGVV